MKTEIGDRQLELEGQRTICDSFENLRACGRSAPMAAAHLNKVHSDSKAACSKAFSKSLTL